MTGIFCGETFTGKHMAQVATTVRAHDLGAASVSVWNVFHGAGNFVIETWPSAMRIEFVFRVVKRCITLAAHIGTTGFIVGIFTGKRAFRAFVQDHPGFFVR